MLGEHLLSTTGQRFHNQSLQINICLNPQISFMPTSKQSYQTDSKNMRLSREVGIGSDDAEKRYCSDTGREMTDFRAGGCIYTLKARKIPKARWAKWCPDEWRDVYA